MSTSAIDFIVAQHAEESAFLWELRERAVCAPHVTLQDLARLDERLAAHLDGLRENGHEAVVVLADALASGAGGEVFAAAVIACEGTAAELVDLVRQSALSTPQRRRGLASALAWLPWEVAREHLPAFEAADSAEMNWVAVSVSASHRRVEAVNLKRALNHDDPRVRARALRLVGEVGLVREYQAVRSSIGSSDPACNFWAAWSLARLDADETALAALNDLAQAPGEYQSRAIDILLRVMTPPAAGDWLAKISRRAGQERATTLAVGTLGNAAFVPWLFEQMEVLPMARAAGEAFSMLTGVHLAHDELALEPPPEFSAGPTEDPDDDRVAVDPDEDLDWPCPEKARAWWLANGTSFIPGERYLLGQIITNEWLLRVLREGRQRQRGAAALEQAVRTRGSVLLNLRARALEQLSPAGP